MTQIIKLWIPLPKVVQNQYIDGLPKDGAYRAVRNGTFPFRTEVIAGRIHVSARDLGLIPEDDPQTEEASNQGESLAATA